MNLTAAVTKSGMSVSIGDLFGTVIGLTVLIINIKSVITQGLTDLLLECWPVTDGQLDMEICISMPSTKLTDRQTVKLPSRQTRHINQLKERRQGEFITFLHSSTALQRKKARALQVAKRFVAEIPKAFRSAARAWLHEPFTVSLDTSFYYHMHGLIFETSI